MLSVGGSPQPLRTAITGHTWDRVHFVVSEAVHGGVSSGAMVEDKEILYSSTTGERGPGLRHLVGAPKSIGITAIRPDDLDSALARIDAALAAELRAGHRVTVDYTGGTKTMTAAMVLAATAHEGVALQFMSGNRPDLRQVSAGSEKPVEMPGDMVGLARLFASARSFTTRRNYGAALAVMKQAERALQNRRGGKLPKSWTSRIAHWQEWLSVLDLWDRFEHDKAWRRWQKAHEQGKDWAEAFADAGFAARLECLAGSAGKPTSELLEDLWLNAQRRADLGLYDDAMARLYRLAEATVQTFLAREEIDTAAVRPEQLAPKLRAKLDDGRSPTVKLSLSDARAQLRHIRPTSPLLTAWPDGLPDWQGQRNNSILAHGFKPINAKDYERATEWFRQGLYQCWTGLLKRKIADQLPDQLPA